jgi:hypothetical protein
LSAVAVTATGFTVEWVTEKAHDWVGLELWYGLDGVPGAREPSELVELLPAATLARATFAATSGVQVVGISGCYVPVGNGTAAEATHCLGPFRMYQVVVSVYRDGLTVDSATMTVSTAEGPPETAVRGLEAVNVGRRSARLEAMLPTDPGGVVERFSYRVVSGRNGRASGEAPVASPNAASQAAAPAAVLAVDVLELLPFTSYVVAVRAHTAAGAGPEAEVAFTTGEDVPSAPESPTYVLLPGTLASGEVRLSWSPPAEANGILLPYLVHVEHSNGTTAAIHTGTLGFNLTLAAPGPGMVLRVQAQTSVGAGPRSSAAVAAAGSSGQAAGSAAGLGANSVVVQGSAAAGVLLLAVALVVLHRRKKDLFKTYRPETDEWEVVREQLELGDAIGSGQYGDVVLAVS